VKCTFCLDLASVLKVIYSQIEKMPEIRNPSGINNFGEDTQIVVLAEDKHSFRVPVSLMKGMEARPLCSGPGEGL
jgi:hypothetical protein